jgi:adenosylcobinamide kinase / adenosylcobinamide-phosphate guanylyltransferase
MPLVVLLGGARCGKSRLAVELALDAGAPVTFIATGEARDEEMEARIAAHRAERPEGWEVVEEPLALTAATAGAPGGHTLVVDCLSLWVANSLEAGDPAGEVEVEAEAAAGAAAARDALTIVVSNEVGLGIVPISELGRVYRDVLGVVNRTFVEASDEAALVVAGRRLDLSSRGPRV